MIKKITLKNDNPKKASLEDEEDNQQIWQSVITSIDKVLIQKSYKKISRLMLSIPPRLNKTIENKESFLENSTIEQLRKTVVIKQTVPKLGLNSSDEKKLKKGKIRFDLSLDLHGCRQQQALNITKEFVNSAYNNNKRTLRLVTGKGTRAVYNIVIDWLNSENTRLLVAYITHAPTNMGGSGVIFVRLRKNRHNR